jgi:regulatory protein
MGIKMRVTGLEEVSKSRSRVFIDEEFAFVLYKGELRSHHICVGQELDREDYDAIVNEVLPRRAKLRAMNLLKGREYTTKQLHDKLKANGYPEQIIQTALDYVAGFHYTDDLRYAVDYITAHESTRSRQRIGQDLAAKGIDRETAQAAWDEWEKLGGRQDEQEMIRALLAKKHYDPEAADRKEKQRLYGFLMRKGFSQDAVRRALFSDELF